ncbi:MAG: DUF2283 domain-containing protein [Patescibacteria group bacterium]
MKKKSPKIEYDKESQVLSVVVKPGKSVDSDIQDNIVVDYDKSGKIVRVNFYGFNFDNFRNNLKALKNFARESEVALSVR